MKSGPRQRRRSTSVQDGLAVMAATLPAAEKTLLVAEDEDELRLLLKGFLETMGYKVFVARDGEEALHVFSGHGGEIDLVLLDAVMPKRSGVNVCQQIRALPGDVPCILLTGYSEEVIRKSPDQPIHVSVVQKPVAFAELARKIEDLLRGSVSEK